MTRTRSRRIADRLGRIASHLMPARQQDWAAAMASELGAIDDDGEALRFASGCLRASAIEALLARLATLRRARHTDIVAEEMVMDERLTIDPRVVGVACGVGATGLGIIYLAAAGAPAAYIFMNSAALAIGLILMAAIGRTAGQLQALRGAAPVLGGSILLATALLGSAADGATRWVHVGSIALQPSLILLPSLIVAFARQRDVAGMAGIAIAALALALQPDRAMAGVLAISMSVLLLLKREGVVVGGVAAALLGFVATLFRPDPLPATPYVDQILFSSYQVHFGVGLAVTAGAALLLTPALWLIRAGSRDAGAAFGAAWLAIVAAAALGNYPTPLVGYGGSAILGYCLSLAAFPAGRGAPGRARKTSRGARVDGAEESRLRLRLT
jgi:hypothetical protein